MTNSRKAQASNPVVGSTSDPKVAAVSNSELPKNPAPLDIWLNPKDGLEFVFIPPGTFDMGAPEDAEEVEYGEQPIHRVTISSGFWLCRTPVTASAYRRFCKANGLSMHTPGGYSNTRWKANEPICDVSWEDAKAYCEWLGGRLPTEAEWEYAARAGTKTAYWWGNVFDGKYAWFKGNSKGKKQLVAEKPANPWKLYDMLGNVMEFCADWYNAKYYEHSPDKDPQGPEKPIPFTGEYPNVVHRGGTWEGYESRQATWSRICHPTVGNKWASFRPVISHFAAGSGGCGGDRPRTS